MMKIWFISDTHCLHENLSIPDVDMVIHCGDESNHSQPEMNEPESKEFFIWYDKLPIKYKIFTPGNHSTAIQAGLVRREDYPTVNFLLHESIDIEGIKIFGSPYTPAYGNSWAYMKKRDRMQLVWDNLPECDILITHGPPKGILDLTEDRETGKPIQVGCKSLFNKVKTIKPKIHAFGHIHDENNFHNYGEYSRWGTKFINCACWSHVTGNFLNGFIQNYEHTKI